MSPRLGRDSRGGALASRRSHFRPALARFPASVQRRAERRDGRRRGEPPGAPLLDPGRAAAHVGHEGRPPAQHRLDHRQRRALLVGRQHQHVVGRPQGADVLDMAVEHDPWCEAEVPDHRPQMRLVRPGPVEVEPPVTLLPRGPRERLEQDVVALRERLQPRDRRELGPPAGGRRHGRRPIEIDGRDPHGRVRQRDGQLPLGRAAVRLRRVHDAPCPAEIRPALRSQALAEDVLIRCVPAQHDIRGPGLLQPAHACRGLARAGVEVALADAHEIWRAPLESPERAEANRRIGEARRHQRGGLAGGARIGSRAQMQAGTELAQLEDPARRLRPSVGEDVDLVARRQGDSGRRRPQLLAPAPRRGGHRRDEGEAHERGG